MIELRECVRRLIDYQTEGYPDADVKEEQAKLNALYDGFTAKYGLINSRGNKLAFSEDSSYCLFPHLWRQLEQWDNTTWRQFRADYSVRALAIRFEFEKVWQANGGKLRSRAFFAALKQRLTQVQEGSEVKRLAEYKDKECCG